MATGMLPHNHGHLTNDDVVEARDHGLIFTQLAAVGYDLYYYGKWHTGAGTAHDYGCEGFSYPGYGNPYLTPEYRAYVEDRGMDIATFNIAGVFYESAEPPDTPLGPGYRLRQPNNTEHVTGVLETPDDTHESFFLSNLACDRLRELAQRDDDRPFFLRVDFYGPHPPYLVGADYLAMYDPDAILEYGSFRDDLADKPHVHRTEYNKPLTRDETLIHPNPLSWDAWQRVLAHIYAHVTMVDAAGGQILDELDRLGLTENTLVVWTTDHGDAAASHGGHLDKDAYLTEEVLRIPMALRWPGRIPAGQTRQDLVSNMDLPVTLLDAAGANAPWPLDGRSLLDILLPDRANGEAWRMDLMCETYGHHAEAMNAVGRALITDRYRYAIYQYLHDQIAPMHELYDLVADPYELKNQVDNPAFSDIITDMREQLRTWRARTGDQVCRNEWGV
jgi:arylsulfatase A-like enzyme